MRVFAPRRVASSGNYIGRGIGIPLDGEWRDVPDYFVQASSGLPVNDVTHAKLVDPCNLDYVVFNGKIKIGANWYPYAESTVWDQGASGLYCVVNYADVTTEKVTAVMEPSPNYKGKNPRRVEKTVTVRHRKPFYFYGSLGERKTKKGNVYCPNLYLYVAATDPSATYSKYFPVYRYDIWMTSDRDGTVVVQSILTKYPELFEGLARICNTSMWSSEKDIPAGQAFIGRVAKWFARNIDAFVEKANLRYELPIYEMLPEEFPDYNPRAAYLLAEDQVIGERLDPLLVSIPYANYWRNWLTQHALLDACESLPRLSDNSIQNLTEIAGFVKSLVVDKRIEIPHSLADAWLSYRYQYNTTKMDVQDAIKFVHRHMDLGSLERMIVGRGMSSHMVNDTPVSCRCQVEVRPKNLGYIQKIWRALDQYGLTPDFYVIWDSIPYSFMVDWFLPIGDILGVWDANSMYFSGEYYDLSHLCYSISYIRELGPVKIKCYTRWAGSVPSSLNSMYWYDPPSATHKQVGYRLLDAGSIFIG